MSLNDYDCVRKIGEGSFGDVWLHRNKTDNKQYVVKRMLITDSDLLQSAQTEAKFLKDLLHPNIVAYRDYFINKNAFYIVMEYCDGGDLSDTITQCKKTATRLPEDQIIRWTLDLCLALQHVHRFNILHRDLKPANIFLNSQKIVKIGDFGIARRLKPGDLATTAVGTPLYISPEIARGEPYDSKVDVWSLGCCIFEMMTLEPAINTGLLILLGLQQVKPMPTGVYCSGLTTITRAMLTMDTNKRPTIHDILQSDIMRTAKQNHSVNQLTRNCRQQLQVSVSPSAARCNQPVSPPARRVVSPPVRPIKPSVVIQVSQQPSQQAVSRGDQHGVTTAAVSVAAARPLPTLSSAQSPDTVSTDDMHLYVTMSRPRRGSVDEARDELAQCTVQLKKLGYQINSKTQLVDTKTGSSFVYDVTGDKDANEKRYQEIAGVLTKYVQASLVTSLNMTKYYLPIDGKSGEAKTYIFISHDFHTNRDKLMILIHGSGAPRAGEWARKVMINDSLEAGSQMFWVRRASSEHFAVVLLNPNQNYEIIAGKSAPVRENSTSTDHVLYVWDHVVKTCPAKKIVVVAHSYGGSNIFELSSARTREFLSRVTAVAFTDSVHNITDNTPTDVIRFMKKHARNWVSDSQPLDTRVTTPDNDVPRRSAGDSRHEWTTPASFNSVFTFLSKQLK